MKFAAWLEKRKILQALSDRSVAGQFGEKKAAKYLKSECSYKVLSKNWRYKSGELDLVCNDGEVLVFVEVRTRRETALVQGFDSIGAHKRKVLLKSCKAYIRSLKLKPATFRFDVVQLTLNENGTCDLKHYKNSQLFPKDFRY